MVCPLLLYRLAKSLSAMKLPSIILALFLSPALWAADGCTFDQANQVRVITAVAKFAPHASVDLDNRQVTWTSTSRETTVFSYGGCADLGSTVSRSTPMKTARTREQVFSVAKELAERFWSNEFVRERLATDTLLAGLKESRFTIEKDKQRATFYVRDPNYVELYVEHTYANGTDQVTIAWQGNF